MNHDFSHLPQSAPTFLENTPRTIKPIKNALSAKQKGRSGSSIKTDLKDRRQE
jgi:hypothetical protein